MTSLLKHESNANVFSKATITCPSGSLRSMIDSHFSPFSPAKIGRDLTTTLTLDSLDSGLFLAEFGVESGFRSGTGDSNIGVEGPLTRPYVDRKLILFLSHTIFNDFWGFKIFFLTTTIIFFQKMLETGQWPYMAWNPLVLKYLYLKETNNFIKVGFPTIMS